MRIRTFLFLIFCANVLFVSAQYDTTETINIGTTYITSPRTITRLDESGNTISIITKKQIESLPYQDVASVLNVVAGVDLRQRSVLGVQSDASIRGGSFDQILILVDGIRMSDPQTGHHQMNLPVPLASIERIEVIKGPMGRRYGLNALSGVINIITRKDIHIDEKHLTVEGILNSFYPSDSSNRMNRGIRANLRGGSKQINAWANLEFFGGEGSRYNTDFNSYKSIAGINAYNPSVDASISILGGAANNSFGASYFYAAPNDKEAIETVNTQFLNLSAEFLKSKKASISVNISNRWNYDHYVYIRQNPSIYQNKHSSTVQMQEVNYLLPIFKGELGLGVEARQESIESNNLGNHQRNFWGSYIDFSQRLWDVFYVSMGGYMMNSDVTGLKFYPGIEFSADLYKNWKLFGSMGTGQRVPTFTDLYYNGPNNLSNPLLLSEYAIGKELGIRNTQGDFSSHLSIYNTQTTNSIDWVKRDTSQTWMPQNYQEINFTGIEGGVSFRKEYFGRTFSLSWDFNTMQNSILVEDGWESKVNLNFVRVQSIVNANFEIFNNLFLNATWRSINRQQSSNTYSLIDVKISYQNSYFKRDYMIYFNSTNITNTQFEEINFIPNPPLGVFIGAKISI